MKSRIVSATEFKTHCLALLDEVNEHGGTITVTKRGRPVATVGPAKKTPWKALKGAWAGRVTIADELLDKDTADLWDVVREAERAGRIPHRNRRVTPSVPTLHFLLDTSVVIRYLQEPHKLSRGQIRILDEAVRRRQPVGISAITRLFREASTRFNDSVEHLFDDLKSNPMFEVLPITFEIAAESASLSALRDPADRAIVATARVHRLRLATSDQRIMESKLVDVID